MSIQSGAANKRRVRIWSALALLAVGTSSLALFVGPSGFDAAPLAALGLLDEPGGFLSLRMVRVFLAVVVGVALCTAGTTLQALLRNPLADPFIIGVSGGAALGGALAVALTSTPASWLLSAASISGASAAALALAWVITRRHVTDGAQTALLVGVVINGFASALITLIKTMVPAAKAQSLLFWLVGTIGYPSVSSLLLAVVVVAVATATLAYFAGDLELLRLGEDEALRLGVDVPRVRLIAYLAASALVGAVVPLTGLIGFIGLVLPHALRLVLGGDLRVLLVASALGGAAVLPLFDAVSRASFIVVDTELPVGALTAIVGAPIFIALLLRRGGLR